MKNGWGQTLTLILTFVICAVSSALWIQGQNQIVMNAVLAIETDQKIMRVRLTTGGWSRSQQQEFVDDLRDMSGHPVPSLVPLGVYLGKLP